jgi:hypothetical protein
LRARRARELELGLDRHGARVAMVRCVEPVPARRRDRSTGLWAGRRPDLPGGLVSVSAWRGHRGWAVRLRPGPANVLITRMGPGRTNPARPPGVHLSGHGVTALIRVAQLISGARVFPQVGSRW